MDRDFLYESLKHIIETDDFTRRMWQLYEEVYHSDRQKPRLEVATTRNDFMMHKPTPNATDSDLGLQQVEYNMCAISLAPLETAVNNWHKFLMSNLLGQKVDNMLMTTDAGEDEVNNPAVGLATTVVNGKKAYDELFGSKDSVVLIVADTPSRNIFDQRRIEIEMMKQNKGLKTLRRTLAQLREAIDHEEVDKSGRLLVEGHEVAIVYCRAGYDEIHYDFSAGDWEKVRRPMELSRAAVIPNVAHQLGNYKKIQQVLCQSAFLEKFGLNTEACEQMRRTFAEMHSLDFDDSGNKAVALGIERYQDYVLKPMQEGGSLFSYYFENM